MNQSLRQAQRLMRCAKAVRQSPIPKAFTMKCFIRGDDWEPELSHGELHTKHWCGTPACVLGHYASRRDLQRAFSVVATRDMHGDSFSMRYNGRNVTFDSPSITNYFGVDFVQMRELFSHNGCNGATTSKQAAEYIEQFVKAKFGFVPKV